MKLEDAFIKAIRMYWEETDEFDSLQTSKGERKYSKKYFDSVEEEFLGSKKDPLKDKASSEASKEKKIY